MIRIGRVSFSPRPTACVKSVGKARSLLYFRLPGNDIFMPVENADAPVVIAREEIYSGRIVSLSLDTVREGEYSYKREVVHHPGGAGAIAVFEDGTVGLVRQYRHPAGRALLELPAGRLEAGEPPEACAARELEEELGVAAGRLERLTVFFTTPGFCEERFWLFLASDLREVAARPDEDEFLEIVRVPFGAALAMAASGEIEDARTIIGLLLAAQRLGLEGAGARAS
jgi:ADP-ribose pyrophosphatase